MRLYFERGLSSSVTSTKTGINIKTVCRYFDQWASQITEIDGHDFLERQKIERSRVIVSFDEQILQAYELADNIENQIKKYVREKRRVPMNLFEINLSAMKYITDLIERKGSFVMLPTVDAGLREKIVERVYSGKT